MIRFVFCAIVLSVATGCSSWSATLDAAGNVTSVTYDGRPVQLASANVVVEAPAPAAEPAPAPAPEPIAPMQKPTSETQRALLRLWELDRAGTDYYRCRDIGQWLVGEYGQLAREPRRRPFDDEDPDANEPWAPTARRANAAFDRDLPDGR